MMMKWLTLIILVLVTGMVTAQDKSAKIEKVAAEKDSAQYELIITETGFQSWFISHRKPMEYNSYEYYKRHNELYVREWNSRVNNPEYGDPYNNPVNYNFKIKYGIEFEYKLFWYFKFIQNKYNMRLLPTERPD
jgi:hypothetical protein